MPAIGDKRKIGKCRVCGAEEYEEYQRVPVYHNDYMEQWRPYPHAGAMELCVGHLRGRIDNLEKLLKAVDYRTLGMIHLGGAD